MSQFPTTVLPSRPKEGWREIFASPVTGKVFEVPINASRPQLILAYRKWLNVENNQVRAMFNEEFDNRYARGSGSFQDLPDSDAIRRQNQL